jgi:arsenate reductase
MTEANALRILILCTGNSARSQIAEALLSTMGKGRFEAASAGSRPAEQVNPFAVSVLAEAGIDWQGRVPRGTDGLEREHWDFVITVCDRAKESCPYFPGQPLLVHWGMPDPAEVVGSDEVKMAAFRDTFTTLSRRIESMLALPIEELEPAAVAHHLKEIGTQ